MRTKVYISHCFEDGKYDLQFVGKKKGRNGTRHHSCGFSVEAVDGAYEFSNPWYRFRASTLKEFLSTFNDLRRSFRSDKKKPQLSLLDYSKVKVKPDAEERFQRVCFLSSLIAATNQRHP